jgi:hypothetical protein
MKVSYSEGLAEVTVEGVPDVVKRGETVEVSAEVGKQLLKQGWQEAGHQKKAEAKAAATPNSVEKENE